MREKLIWGCLLFALVFPRAGTKIGGLPLTSGSVLLGLFLFLWLITNSGRKVLVSGIPFTHRVFLLFSSLMLLTIAVFKLDHPLIERITIIVPLFIPLVVYYAAYPLAVGWFKNTKRIENLLLVFVSANISIGAYGLMQYFLGHYQVLVPGLTMSWADAQVPGVFESKCNLMWDGQALKITSTFQNGNIFGVYLAMTAPLMAVAFLDAKTTGYKVLAALASLLTVANVPITLARSAFFGSSVALFLLFLLRKKMKDRIQIAGLYFVMVGVIFSKERLFERMILSFFDPSLGGREEAIKELSLAISGVWDFLFGLPFKPMVYNYGSFFERASENIYVTLFYWLGLVGLILFLIVSIHVIWVLFKRTRAGAGSGSVPAQDSREGLKGLGQGLVAGLGGYLIMAFVESAFYLPPTALNYWFLLGLGAALANLLEQEEFAS